MENFDNYLHLTQSELWGEFKTLMGTPAVKVGDIQFTKHKIPYSPYFVAYAPKVNFRLQNFDYKELKAVAKSEKCVAVRFDVPNIPRHSISKLDEKWQKNLTDNCMLSPRSTFSKWNIILDITFPEEKLLENLHQKTRYNSRYAAKKGVVVRIENNEKGVSILNKLMSDTAKRQKFLIHSSDYYKTVFETYNAQDKAYLLIAYLGDEPLAAWLLLIEKDILYYPYGASSDTHRNLMASSLLGWEAIKLGKKKDCRVFDMWGATNDRNHPWWGFTQFKIRYGGELIEYIDSYDFVISNVKYNLFNTGYNAFWKIRKKLL